MQLRPSRRPLKNPRSRHARVFLATSARFFVRTANSRATHAVGSIAFALSLAVATLGAGIASAGTIRVPQDHGTIQAAIAAASGGDVVEVDPGLYLESIDFLGKDIVVRSTGGAEVTTIDGQSADIVVRMMSNEPVTSALEGFTIRNGVAPTTCCFGGAIMCLGCRGTIRDNIIRDSFGWTGGIAVLPIGGLGEGSIPADPVITGNTILDNTGQELGGGIGCFDSLPLVENNVFRGNRATGGIWDDNAGPAGAALYIVRADGFVFRNNFFENNDADHAGGGIFVIESSGLIEDNYFLNNAARFGGGIHLESNSGLTTIRRNTFFGNRVEKIPDISANDTELTLGAGVATFTAPVDLLDNVFVRNRGTSAVCTILPGPVPFLAEGCAFGGAIALFGSAALVERNRMAHNESEFGGAGWLSDDTLLQTTLDLDMRDNVMTWNTASEAVPGLMCQDGALCRLDRNQILDSKLTGGESNFPSGGGLTFASAGTSSVTNSVFAGNQGQFGGAIGILNTNADIVNNTIAGNEGIFMPDAFTTGALFLAGSGSNITPAIDNNIFLANDSVHIREADFSAPSSIGSNLFFSGGDVFYNIAEGPALTVATLNAQPEGSGNIEGNPLVAAQGLCRDYHLGAGSAAEDTGNTAFATGLDFDLDGDARVAGSAVDIGADEFVDPAAAACPDVHQPAFYRPSTNTFHIDLDGNGGVDEMVSLGQAGDLPIAGHWNGPGRDGVGVYRPSSTTFFLDSDRNGSADRTVTLAGGGDLPISGDWDGDGGTDIGTWNSVTFEFLLDADLDGVGEQSVLFGQSGDLPIAGDWDGDGDDDIGLYRPSTASFLLDVDHSGTSDATLAFGATNLIGISGDWNGDGVGDIGVFNGSEFLLDLLEGGAAEQTIALGTASDIPLTADWVPEPASDTLRICALATLALFGRQRSRRPRRRV